tara:strand:- start:169 stop:405 length:237 start_codon:yes stop_codon:yes gene_type:complete
MSEEQKISKWLKEAKEWKPVKPNKKLKKAIEAVKLHQEPGHPISSTIVREYAQKFGVDHELVTFGLMDTFPWEEKINE